MKTEHPGSGDPESLEAKGRDADVGKLELETLEVSGAAVEMGGAQGEHFRERIREFVDMRLTAVSRYLAERQGPSLRALREVGASSLERYRQWDAAGASEHSGIAAGAHCDAAELHTVVQMTDLRDAILLAAPSGTPLVARDTHDAADAEGCSAVLVPASQTADGRSLVGQTWDLNPPDLAFVAAIKRTPKDGPRTWSVTCTGCLTLMGINERGLCVGTTNIKTFGSRPGVGYVAILHRAVRAKTAAEAADLVRHAPHAGAHTYWLADAERQIELESSPNGNFLRDTATGAVFRTNHCLAEEHVAIQGEEPNESSRHRYAFLAEAFAAGASGRDGSTSFLPMDRQKLQRLFADRSQGHLSINRYAEDGQGTATNAVFVAEPATARAWACRGPADRGAWRELSFD